MNPTPRAERLPTATPRERREAVVQCISSPARSPYWKPGENRWRRTHRPALDRFWEKVDKSGDCWLWLGNRQRKGYGLFKADKDVQCHRWIYEQCVGPIPEGLVIDHICNNPPCVRPSHLRPLTSRQNTLRGNGPVAQNARKTHCKAGGHPLNGTNLYVSPDGKRHCRICKRAGARRQRQGVEAS